MDTLLPSHLLCVYAEPLAAGRRVLVVGDSTQDLGSRLLSIGARLVYVYDPDAERVRRTLAASQHLSGGAGGRGVVVRHLREDELDVRDGAFDLVLVPDVAILEDPTALVARLRRVVDAEGAVLVAARNPQSWDAADVPDGTRVIDYYELYDIVSLQFSCVRMIGQVPFFGAAIAELGESDEEPEVSVHTELSGDPEPPEYFIALASHSDRVRLEPYAIVQLPRDAVSMSLGVTLEGVGAADRSVLAEATARSNELEAQFDEQRAEIARLEAEIAGFQAEIGRFPGETAPLHAEIARLQGEIGRFPGEIAPLHAEIARLQAEIGRFPSETGPLHAEMARLQVEIGRLQVEIGRLQPEMARVKSENGRLQPEIGRLQAEIARLRAEAGRGITEHEQATFETSTRIQQLELDIDRRREHAMALEEAVHSAEETASSFETRAREAEQTALLRAEQCSTLLTEIEVLKGSLEEERAAAEQKSLADSEEVDRLLLQFGELEEKSTLVERELSQVAETHGAELSAIEARLVERGHRVAELERELARRERITLGLIADLEERPAEPIVAADAEDAADTGEVEAVSSAPGVAPEVLERLARENAEWSAKLDEMAFDAARREGELHARTWRIAELEVELSRNTNRALDSDRLGRIEDELDILRRALAQEHEARRRAESGEELLKARAELQRQAVLLEQLSRELDARDRAREVQDPRESQEA